MSLTIAIQILRAVDSAADVFPPLKSATGGALFIAETVKKFKRSKEDWNRLSERIQTYVAVVMKSLQEDGPRKKDWTESLETLNSALLSIRTKIEGLQNQKRLKQWKKYLSTDGEIVQDLRTEFDDAIQLCQFQVTILSTSEVLEQLRGASAPDIVEKLLRTFKQEIVSEIDWSAAFSRLPDPAGTSWNPARACLPGTRTLHLAEISSWISAVPNESSRTAEIYLVADALGSGKTALAHAVCQNAHQAGYLVASFFFTRQDSTKSTPRNLFASIIRGLGSIDTQVKKAIAQRLEADTELTTADPIRQFKDLLVPICNVLPTHRPLVIVIDALDEGYDEDLINILRNSIPLLPRAFRVVVTSRPEERIMSQMSKVSHIRRSEISLSGMGSRADVEKYVNDRLQQAEWGSDVSPVLREKFITKTEGSFLWAATALSHVNMLYDPCSELQDLIDSSSESWSQGKNAENKLDDLYQQILSSFDWTDARFVRAYQSILGAIVTLKEPLSLRGLSSLYAAEKFSIKDIARICSRMHTFLARFDQCSLDQPIHLLHLSIQEYLTKRAPSPYLLDTSIHHPVLASCCLKTIEKELVDGNIPQLGYSVGKWDGHHIPWIPKLERKSISEQLWYSVCFFADHILLVPPENASSSLTQILKKILFEKARQLLEITASMGRVADLGAVRKWMLTMTTLYDGIDLDNEAIDQELSYYLQGVSMILSQSGRIEEALQAINYAVEAHRRLAESQPDASNNSDLAKSLHELSIRLASLGHISDALPAIEEAVQLRRHLAAAQPAKFEADLAMSLNCLSNWLGELDRHADALTAIEEAVEINRRLAVHQPTVFEPNFATSVDNLSRCLSHLGHHKEALTANEEAIGIHRRLAVEQPDAFEPNLAQSLYNLSIKLSNLGRQSDALTAIEESVEIYRRLANFQPAAFEADLADSLYNLSLDLASPERLEEALNAAREAADIRRQLAAIRPAIYNAKLKNTLHLISKHLVALGQQEEALKATQEADAISS